MNHRPGATHYGPRRAFLARALLLVTVSFLIAAGGVAALMSLGAHPIGWHVG